ncbi:phosphotransferase [Streptosporangium sp. NPDC049046]|uniref:phosphotransferase n=1 Tax=Streptosporangium sp. NPDC049046 TaxID=3155031 RepID=UPI00341CEA18
MAFPRTSSEITLPWLAELLREHHPDAAAPVAFETTPLKSGVGEMGTLVRVGLGYADGDRAGPASLIAKFATDNEHHRERARSIRLYEREVRFYRELAAHVPARVPHAYLAAVDDDSARYCLVLEDFSDHIPGDEVRGCTPGEAALAVAEVAKVHAAFWNRTDGPELAWVPRHDGVFAANRHRAVIQGWPNMIANHEAQFGDQVRAYEQAYVQAFPRLLRLMARQPVTFVHGDLRMDNLLFGRSGRPDPVVLLDWQGSVVGRGVQDVAYLVTHSMTTNDRRAAESELIDLYVRTLNDAGVDYRRDEAEEHYRLAMLFIFSIVVGITGGMNNKDPRAIARKKGLVDRALTAMDDWKVWDLL